MVSNYKIRSADNNVNGLSTKIANSRKIIKRNKRKRIRDRRSSVRDGVIVTLSFQSNKRNGSDRRARQA